MNNRELKRKLRPACQRQPIAMEQEFRRFKQIREELNLTQSAFAEQLGIGVTTADIERGRTRIPGFVVKELLKRHHINPLWLFGESEEKYLRRAQTSAAPAIVTVASDGTENIVMVSAKAAAGYPHNIGDSEWFEALPAFSIPLPEYHNATFRGFQVDGDSMQPALQTGDWIMGKAVSDLENLSRKQMYVIVTQDSVLVKKVQQEKGSNVISLISLNPEYDVIRLNMNEIKEVWQVVSKISSVLEPASEGISLSHLYEEIRGLKEEVRKIAR